MKKRKKISTISFLMVIVAAACAIVGIFLALVADIQNPPVYALCFGGLIVAVCAYFVYSYINEFHNTRERFDGEE